MTAASETSRGLLRSSGAATLSQMVRVVAMLATHLALRRLIPPADWGLRDWTEALFLVLATVRDLGLPSHVVRLRPAPFGTLLRVQALWGGALATALLVAAPLVAEAFRTPRPDVTSVIRLMALYLVIEGLASVPLTHFEARLEIGRAVAPELVRTLTYCLGALALALAGAGVWSFVLAMVGSQLVYAAMLWSRARSSIELRHVPGTARALVGQAVPLGSIWLVTFAVTYADALILGSRFPDAVVGGYMFAYVWAFFVSRILQPPLGRALYPAFVQYRESPGDQFSAYRLATKLLLAIELPAALLLCLNAELAIRILGGSAYLGQIGLLRLLAFAPLVDPFGRFGGELLIARHRERARLLSLLLQLLGLVGGGLLLSARYGPVGMAWANFLPLGAPALIWALARGQGRQLGALASDLAEVYLAPLPLFALAWWLGRGSLWGTLVASLLAALASLAWFWFRFGERFQSFFTTRRETVVDPAPASDRLL